MLTKNSTFNSKPFLIFPGNKYQAVATFKPPFDKTNQRRIRIYNYQYMLTFTQPSQIKHHRTQSRTQQSQEKVYLNQTFMQVNKGRRMLVQELKGSVIRDKIFSENHPKNQFNFTSKSIKMRQNKSKSKSFRDLFKQAHLVFSDETFLPKRIVKDSFSTTFARNNLTRQTNSEKNLSQQSNFRHQLPKKKVLISSKSSHQTRTITYEQSPPKSKRKISIKKAGESEPIPDESSNKKAFKSPSRKYVKKQHQRDEASQYPLGRRIKTEQNARRQNILQYAPEMQEVKLNIVKKTENIMPSEISAIQINYNSIQTENQGQALSTIQKYVDTIQKISEDKPKILQQKQNPVIIPKSLKNSNQDIINTQKKEDSQQPKTAIKKPSEIIKPIEHQQRRQLIQEQMNSTISQHIPEAINNFSLNPPQQKQLVTFHMPDSMKESIFSPKEEQSSIQATVKKSQHQKQKYYLETNTIDLLDIEQIKFQDPKPTKKVQSKDKHEETAKKQASKPKQQIKIKQAPPLKLKQQPQKFQQQLQKPQANQTPPPKTPKMSQSSQKLVTPKTHQQNVKELSSISQLRESQETGQIKTTIKKISQWKYSLEMLAQMATFFSQHSKTLKYNSDSKQFLRQNSNFKWHTLAYLFFKFFYSNLILYEHFYKWSAGFVKIRKEEISQFEADNLILKQTLSKIQKSVKKNVTFTDGSQGSIFRQIPNFEKGNVKEIIEELTNQKTGKSESYSYFKNLIEQMYESAAITIKSLFVSKVIYSETDVGVTFKTVVFRILNACTLLYMYCNGLKSWQVQPFTSSQQMSNPTPSIFKKFYNCVTQTVLTSQ